MCSTSARGTSRRSCAARLVISKVHVMPPLVERDEVAALVRTPAFSYGDALLRSGKVGKIANEFGGGHILLFLGQLAHSLDRLLQQFAHEISIPQRSFCASH